MSESPIDVVVVTYNSADVIGGLLDGLPDAFAGLAHRVVVVDNASPDTTRAVVSGRGDVLLVEAENLGFGAGINAGVSALAGTGPILVLNPDVQLAPGSVTGLLRVIGTPGCGVAVPRLAEPDGSTARSLRREPSLPRTLGMGDSAYPLLSEVVNEPAAYASQHPVDWATGAVLMIARACFDQLGGFDESFFMYSEETDFSLRARDAGFRTLFAPDATAVHLGGGSGRNPDLYAMQVLNRIRLYRRRHALLPSVALLGLTVAREAAFAVRRDVDSQRALASLLRPSRKPRQLPWPGGPLRRSAPVRRGQD